VHYEVTDDVRAAVAREKEVKSWRRSKKIALIKLSNPTWQDLSDGWYDEV
jgi:putative endonuclease